MNVSCRVYTIIGYERGERGPLLHFPSPAFVVLNVEKRYEVDERVISDWSEYWLQSTGSVGVEPTKNSKTICGKIEKITAVTPVNCNNNRLICQCVQVVICHLTCVTRKMIGHY